MDTYTLLPAPGRVRRHHPVQLPGHDSAVDVPHGHRHRQHLRAQALRAGPAWSPCAWCELALEAGVPAGVLNVIHGGEDAVNAMCDHPDIKADQLRRLHQGRHPRLQPRQPERQARAVHDGRQEPRHRAARCQQGADRSTPWPVPPLARPASAAWRCRWWCWWARPRKWLPELVAKAKTLKVSGGTEPGTDVGPRDLRAPPWRALRA